MSDRVSGIPASPNAEVNNTAAGSTDTSPVSEEIPDGFSGATADAKSKASNTLAQDGKASVSGIAYARLGAAKTSTHGTNALGDYKASADVEVGHVSVAGSASFEASAKNMSIDGQIKVHVDANLIQANGMIHQEIPFTLNGEPMRAKVDISAKGAVGLNGDLSLTVHVGQDGVRVAPLASGNLANASVTVKAELDDDKTGGELAEASGTIGVAYGVKVGNDGSLGLTKGASAGSTKVAGWDQAAQGKYADTVTTTRNIAGRDVDVKSKSGTTFGVPTNYVASASLGPVSGAFSAKVNLGNVAQTTWNIAKGSIWP